MRYEYDWAVLWQYRQLLLVGLANTMLLFVLGTILSITVGLLVGICSAAKSLVFRVIALIYVELNRNTPLVVKVFFLYFGFGMDAYMAALIGLTAHQSAYKAEVVRSGIQSVSKGQFEAGLASGFSPLQTMWRIILPQALTIVIPPMSTQTLEVLKNTSVAMAITIPELTFQTQEIEVQTLRGFEAATAATGAYLLIGLIVTSLAIALEHRLRVRKITGVAAVGVRPLQAEI